METDAPNSLGRKVDLLAEVETLFQAGEWNLQRAPLGAAGHIERELVVVRHVGS